MREAGMRGNTRALGRFSAQSVGIAAVVCAAMAAETTTAAAQDSANVESSPLTVQQLDARDQASTGGGVVQPRSASGCTSAPGNFGALNCIYANGGGDFVNYIRATYDTGAVRGRETCAISATSTCTRSTGTPRRHILFNRHRSVGSEAS